MGTCDSHPLTPRARLPSIDLGQSDRRLSSLKKSRRGCYLKGCISKVGQNKFIMTIVTLEKKMQTVRIELTRLRHGNLKPTP